MGRWVRAGLGCRLMVLARPKPRPHNHPFAPRKSPAPPVRVHCGTDPPGETTLDPSLDDAFPDYDTEFSAT
jgi:hypothetical protein